MIDQGKQYLCFFFFCIEPVVLFSESRITKVVKKLVNMEEDKVITLFHTLSTDHHHHHHLRRCHYHEHFMVRSMGLIPMNPKMVLVPVLLSWLPKFSLYP
jgi:hypothetical protein